MACPQLFLRFFAGAGALHLIAFGGQRHLHNATNLRIVVHHQDAPDTHRTSFSCPCSCASGREKWKTEPVPGLLSAQISPPCARTISRAMNKPSPAPDTWFFV